MSERRRKCEPKKETDAHFKRIEAGKHGFHLLHDPPR